MNNLDKPIDISYIEKDEDNTKEIYNPIPNLVFFRPLTGLGNGAMEYFYNYGDGNCEHVMCGKDKFNKTLTYREKITEEELNKEAQEYYKEQNKVLETVLNDGTEYDAQGKITRIFKNGKIHNESINNKSYY